MKRWHLKWKIRWLFHRLGCLDWWERFQARWRFRLKRVHDSDFLYFRHHQGGRPPKLICDIGANVGQSAYSFALAFPDAHIMSFEANPAMEKQLQFVERALGHQAFSFKICGLGATYQKRTLHVPRIKGFPFWQEATLDRQVLSLPETLARMERVTGSRDYTVDEVELEVMPFDDLGLRPDIIKIDVQGQELEVLKGMEKTLHESRPLVLLEAEWNRYKITKFMRERGYQPKVFDPGRRSLVEARVDFRNDNLFFV